ncbi:AAA family ATPase [Siccirubricoccus sp. G192]|uniref:AAA family ATPase n=1 Tax=Siccirubricoccus sp. G192 TaxID=2849651 RepID=UPI001C2BB913|nr:AAA family ATPase [Siccirubricoccus sp. G192]MBV1799815.1 AAA family ATPase [Siccirubricoccus sp. G192]
MRPLSLTLQAFSAYGGRQEIDFGQLGEHRLFLIAGPTGAGKTTVLDGICYALFGESSGGPERGAGHLRSHHAAAAMATEVTLDFALGQEQWRICRRPTQMRPKQRGGGFVEERSSVALSRLTGPGNPLERDAEVRARVTELLGYHAAEFRQVVLLPQGRFRELLSAGPGARQEILRTLFRTDLYERIQARLKEQADSAEKTMAQWSARRRVLIDQAGAADLASAEAARGAMQQALTEAEAAREAAALREREAAALAEAGRRAAETLAAREAAEAGLAALTARAAAVAADRARLDAARRADRLRGEAEAARQARQAADQAAAQATADAARASAAQQALAAATAALADAPAREAEARAAAAESIRLQGLLDLAERVATAAMALQEARTAAQAAKSRHDAAAATAATASTAAEAADRALAEREAVAAQAERHRLGLEAATRQAADATALDQALRALARCQAALPPARAALAEAEAAHAASRAARLEAAQRLAAEHAAVLAAGLQPGAPCPVCGGTHHPTPAQPESGPLPDLALLDAAEARAAAALDAARAKAQAAEGALRLAEAEQAARRDRLGANAAPPAGALAEAKAALATAEAALRALPGLRQAQAAARAEALAATQALEGASAAERAAALALSVAEATHADRLAALPPGAGSTEALRSAIAGTAATARGLEAALGRQREARAAAEAAATAAEAAAAASARAAEAAATARATRRVALEAAARAAGFADLGSFAAALIEPAETDALAAEVSRFDAAMAAAEAAAVQARAAAAGLTTPDLPALEAALAVAGTAAREAADAATTRRNALEAQDRLLAEITATEHRLAESQADYGLKRDLADLARGNNPKKLNLEGFVLRSLFDEALAAANRRLRGMLGGRYAIRRREEPLSGRAAVGLDIEVLDQWNDQARPAGTLSGGEGFCASLALALGLADTVQAHAGARRIDSLFIDEGFGSLDGDTLETAMEVLTGLHGQDRLVGVISHVAGLRDWIPARLDVTPGRRGSSAAFRFG